MTWLSLCLLGLASVGADPAPGGKKGFENGETMEIMVNSLISKKNAFPIPFYNKRIPFPRPREMASKPKNMRLGQWIFGDRIQKSPLHNFTFTPFEPHLPCEIIKCNPRAVKGCADAYGAKFSEGIDAKGLRKFEPFIADEYRYRFILDNLPVSGGVRQDMVTEIADLPVLGVPMGEYVPYSGKYKVFNHFHFHVDYHETVDGTYRMVKFTVKPYSSKEPCSDVCPEAADCELYTDSDDLLDGTAKFSYSISFDKSTQLWKDRWEYYVEEMAGVTASQHWMFIWNSFLAVLILAALIAFIIRRVLRRDYTRYNTMDNDEPQEDTGWKVIHADVFRTPSHAALLTVLVGTGTQFVATLFAVTLLAIIHYLAPGQRGKMLTLSLILFPFMGFIGGYVVSRFSTTFFQKQTKWILGMTALGFPGTAFACYVALDLIAAAHGSSTAIPVFQLVRILALWICVSVPLVCSGAYFGSSHAPIEFPVRINIIPTPPPARQWYTVILAFVLTGLIPFLAAFFEIKFMIVAVWEHQFYNIGGFLALTLAILVLSCSEMTMVMTYFQLVSEDWRWWWRAFLMPASSGVYLFGYSLVYMKFHLGMVHFWSIVYFSIAMGLVSLVFAVFMGTVGFLSTFFFVRMIYGAIKVD